jgi:hypothetical protein
MNVKKNIKFKSDILNYFHDASTIKKINDWIRS